MYVLTGWVLQILYGLGVSALALYGFHALWLTWKVRRQLNASHPVEEKAILCPPQDDWPPVTIQLPIYNERHVIERLIDACVNQSYPRERLQIQVLDDSTDGTRALITKTVAQLRQQGHNVGVVHRSERTGFKAGALANALPSATGEYIALFDADFVPSHDFLLRTIPYFYREDSRQTGFVQTRWSHLNRSYSALTMSQALALDGHFAVEQEGRQEAGYFFGFNGSGGVWRRACIEDPAVGGWQADTLCEDLDLSYRAQLAGWRGRYVNHIAAPAEIPPQLTAFKRQQFRWAKGSVQTLRKLRRKVWQSDRSLITRLFGLFHLGSYLLHPMLLLLVLVTGPLMLTGTDPAAPLALLSLTAVGPPVLYAIGQLRLNRRRWWRNLLYLPILMLLGTGICVNNTRAVWQGLRAGGGQFLRTPKFRVEQTGDGWRSSTYRLSLEPLFFGELFMLIYALAVAGLAIQHGKWLSIPFLLLYAGGFSTMVLVDLWQLRPVHPSASGVSRVGKQPTIETGL